MYSSVRWGHNNTSYTGLLGGSGGKPSGKHLKAPEMGFIIVVAATTDTQDCLPESIIFHPNPCAPVNTDR